MKLKINININFKVKFATAMVGCVNLVNNGFIKKTVVLLCDIYMYRNQRKQFREDPSTLA